MCKGGGTCLFIVLVHNEFMPRKPRLEYENAFYNVMNWGRRREIIFNDVYYQTFIDLLKNAHERISCIIHSYCLMGNHCNLSLVY